MIAANGIAPEHVCCETSLSTVHQKRNHVMLSILLGIIITDQGRVYMKGKKPCAR